MYTTIHMISGPHFDVGTTKCVHMSLPTIMIRGDYIHPRTESWVIKLIYHLWQGLFASKIGW